MTIKQAKMMYFESKCNMQNFCYIYGDISSREFKKINISEETLDSWKKEYIEKKWKEIKKVPSYDNYLLFYDICNVIQYRSDANDKEYIKEYIENYGYLQKHKIIGVLTGGNIKSRDGLILHFYDLGQKKFARELFDYSRCVEISHYEKIMKKLEIIKKTMDSINYVPGLDAPKGTFSFIENDYVDAKWHELKNTLIGNNFSIFCDICNSILCRNNINDSFYIKNYISNYSYTHEYETASLLIGDNTKEKNSIINHFIYLGDYKTAFELYEYSKSIIFSRYALIKNKYNQLETEINKHRF